MKKSLIRLSEKNLSGQEVADIFGNPQEYPADRIKEVSIKTAIEYWNEQLDFRQANCIMNNLQTYWVTNDHYCQNFGFGETPWRIYEAFDSGEYSQHIDGTDNDPEELYTKPQIQKILKENHLIK